METLFEDIVVLDLSSVLAGPLTGSFFAEVGARVIKVEHKSRGGDVTREWRLPSEPVDQPLGAYYASANYGKEVLQLDLDTTAGYDKLIELVRQSDVVISNFQKRVADKLHITHEALKRYNENIIFAQLSAYTYDDPRPGYDLVMQAETGWISMTGSEGQLAKLPVAMIDIAASHQLRESILIGLIKKFKTGEGSHIHVSLYQSAIASLANQASNYLMVGHVPRPMGTLHPNIAPYGDVFLTKDRFFLMLAVGSDAQFEKLVKTLNFTQDELNTFRVNKDRVLHRQSLHATLQSAFETYRRNEIVQLLSDASVPFCIVKNLKEVFESELASEMIVAEQQEGVDTKRVRNVAFKFL